MSDESRRKFFHECFCVWGKLVAPNYIHMPKDEESARHVLAKYERRALPGVGSGDCVYLVWDKCAALIQSQCKGKDKVPTLAFEVVASLAL